jgi:hypothetical protein
MPSPEVTFVVGLILLLGFFLEGLGIYHAIMFAVPLIAVFIGVKLMVAILSIVDLLVSYVHYQRIPMRTDLSPVKTQLTAVFSGTFVGVILLKTLPDEFLGLLLGAVILAIAYDIRSGGRVLQKLNAIQEIRLQGLTSRPRGLKLAVLLTIVVCILSVYFVSTRIQPAYSLIFRKTTSSGEVCPPDDATCIQAEAIKAEVLAKQSLDVKEAVALLAPVLASLLLIPVCIIMVLGLWNHWEWVRVLSVTVYSLVSMVLLLSMLFTGVRVLSLLVLIVVIPAALYLIRDDVRLLFTGYAGVEGMEEGGVRTATDKKLCFISGLGGGLLMFNRPTMLMHFSNKYGSGEVLESTASAFLFYDALFRCIMLTVVGLISVNILVFTLLMTPFVLIGLYAGRTRVSMDEVYLRGVVALILSVFGLILLLWNILPTVRLVAP